MILRSLFAAFCLTTSSFALTADELQGFINEAVKSEKGSEVVIPPGKHVLNHSLVIQNAKQLRIAGLDAETTVLQLPPLAFAEVAEAATKQGVSPAYMAPDLLAKDLQRESSDWMKVVNAQKISAE